VRLDSGRRVAVVEKYSGPFVGNVGDAVFLLFQPEDCILVPQD